jgi:AraC-like DNA-binding protein
MMKTGSSAENFSYQTVDIYHASKQLLRYFGDHRLIPADSRTFLFREHASSLNDVVIHHIEFVGGVSIGGCEPHGHFLLHLVVSGEVEIDKGKKKVRVSPGEAFVLGPDRAPPLNFPDGGHLLIVQLDAVKLEQHARTIIQHTPQEHLLFQMTDFSSQQLGHFQQVISLFLQQLSELPAGESLSLWEQQVEQFLLSEVLLKFTHSYSHLIGNSEALVMPRSIRLAREYMDANIASDISLDDLSDAADVSKRSLLYTFKQHCGTTPMKYLMALRLDGLHRALLNATGEMTVTDAALTWGLTNPGRLSKYYQQRFGELPSATLAR